MNSNTQEYRIKQELIDKTSSSPEPSSSGATPASNTSTAPSSTSSTKGISKNNKRGLSKVQTKAIVNSALNAENEELENLKKEYRKLQTKFCRLEDTHKNTLSRLKKTDGLRNEAESYRLLLEQRIESLNNNLKLMSDARNEVLQRFQQLNCQFYQLNAKYNLVAEQYTSTANEHNRLVQVVQFYQQAARLLSGFQCQMQPVLREQQNQQVQDQQQTRSSSSSTDPNYRNNNS